MSPSWRGRFPCIARACGHEWRAAARGCLAGPVPACPDPDTAASLTPDYTEAQGSFVKLLFEEGEIDFVAAPNLLDDAWETWDIGGRPVKVETAGEIIAKKMYHRGDRVTARDLFDLALVVDREPQQLLLARPYLLRHRRAFLEQTRHPHPSLRAAFDAIATLEYRPSFDDCVQAASDFLAAL